MFIGQQCKIMITYNLIKVRFVICSRRDILLHNLIGADQRSEFNQIGTHGEIICDLLPVQLYP
jgi:hypothetical protein